MMTVDQVEVDIMLKMEAMKIKALKIVCLRLVL
jgi:hypothetical protein